MATVEQVVLRGERRIVLSGIAWKLYEQLRENDDNWHAGHLPERPLTGAWFIFISLLTFSAALAAPSDEDVNRDAGRGAAILIVTRAAGLTSTEVETTITNPLERRLAQARGARQIESRTIAGLSAIRASFGAVREELALATVDAVVRGAASDLPTTSSTPLVMSLNFNPALPVGYVIVSGENLADAARMARQRLLLPLNNIAGMGPLAVLGDRPRQISIRLDPVRLMARQKTAADVMMSLKLHSPPLASSVFRAGGTAFAISLTQPTLAELSAISLIGQGSDVSTLADVARLSEAIATPPRSTRVDGAERALVPIYAAREADSSRIGDAVRRTIEHLNGAAAADSEFQFLSLSADGAPADDDGQITIGLRLASGTRFEVTEKVREAVEGIVRGELADDVKFIVSEVGVGEDWPAAFSPNAAESDATLRIQLSEERKSSTGEAAARLTRAFGEHQKSGRIHEQVFVLTSASEAVDVRVVARSDDTRRQLERLLAVLGTSFSQSRILERLDSPAYQVSIDSRKAADLGIKAGDVQVAVAAFTGGSAVAWTDGRTGVRLQLLTGVENFSLEALQNVPVTTASNRPVPLGNLIHIRQTKFPVEIDHFNLEPAFRAQFIVERGQRESAVSKLNAAIGKLQAPDAPRMEIVDAPAVAIE
jgi:multidrug efflux pump subunit AcrB